MNRPQTVLVVAATPSLGTRLSSWLEENGYVVRLIKTYAAGKVHLSAHPDFLLTELELGAYNGLQLALHARAERISPIVVGPADPVLQREAAQLGITYICKDQLNGDALRTVMHKHEDDAAQTTPSELQRNVRESATLTRWPVSGRAYVH